MLIKGSQIRKLIREELKRSMIREVDGDGLEDPITAPDNNGPLNPATGAAKKGTCNPAVREIQKIIGTKPDCIWAGNTQEKFEQFINTFELKLEDASNSVISLDDVKKSWSKTGPKIKSINGNPIAGYKGTATGLLVFLKDMQRFQSDAKNKTGFADTGTGAEVEDMSADSGTAQLNKNVVSIINMVLAGGHPFPANLRNEKAMISAIVANYSTKEEAANMIIDAAGDALLDSEFETATNIDSLSDRDVKSQHPDEMKVISAAVIELNADLKEARIRRLIREVIKHKMLREGDPPEGIPQGATRPRPRRGEDTTQGVSIAPSNDLTDKEAKPIENIKTIQKLLGITETGWWNSDVERAFDDFLDDMNASGVAISGTSYDDLVKSRGWATSGSKITAINGIPVKKRFTPNLTGLINFIRALESAKTIKGAPSDSMTGSGASYEGD